jgi:hypothetical protein
MQEQVARRLEPPFRPFRIVGSCPEAAVGVVDQYLLLLWRRQVVLPPLEWVRKAFDSFGQSGYDKVVFVTTVESACDISTSPVVRKEIATLLKTNEKKIACAAIVFEEAGFKMTIIRSIVTAIYLASRSRFPNSVFASLDMGLHWASNTAHTSANLALNPGIAMEAVNRLRSA